MHHFRGLLSRAISIARRSSAGGVQTKRPSPPDPDSKKFWRVHVDADIDTDQDGSPDWAEFEIAARGTGVLVSGVTADPFDADTNHDGIPDREQLDSGLDGTPDAMDADADDNTVIFPIGPVPRYALFPITNAQPTSQFPNPFQISDKGTVLYDNGTWRGGTWTPLALSASGLVHASARAINDSDKILGVAYDDDTDLPVVDYWGYACYWSRPTAQPALIETVGNDPIRAGFQDDGSSSGELFGNLLSPGPVLANDGGFYFPANRYSTDPQGWIFLHQSRWKIPDGQTPASESEVPSYTAARQDL
jgi:hypothetical protein